MTLIVDASVAVEFLLRTALGERAEQVFGDAALAAPELIDVEVLAVLRREVLAGHLAVRRAAEAIDDLREWDLERIAHRTLLPDAWSLHGRVSGYDAFYVAAARVRRGMLVTADGPLARAPSLGIAIQNIRIA
jgi:predicted nucleic acid-binding protein